MKTRILFLLAALSAIHSLRAQWIEQGFDLVPNSSYVRNLKVIDSQTVWANLYRYAATPATVARSTDGGASWQIFEIPDSPDTKASGLSAKDANTAWVALRSGAFPFDATLSKIVRTTDGGATWQTLLTGPAVGNIVHFFDDQNGLSYVNVQNMMVTSDGGLTWEAPASIPAVSGLMFEYGVGENYDVVGNTIWIGLRDGTLLKSTDQGKNWTLQTTPLNSALSAVSFTDANHGMATSMFEITPQNFLQNIYPARVIRTTDGGETWAEIPRASLPFPNAVDPANFFTKALEGIPGTAGTYLLSVGGYGGSGFQIYKSPDQGDTWTLYSNCPQRGFGIETFDFLSPAVGWAGSAGAAPEGPLFYKPTTDVIQSTVTYRVDLGNRTPSGAGVHVATDYDGWSTSAHPMTNVGGSVWETTLSYPVGTTIRYKFLNGNAWGQNESVPEGCGALNSEGAYDRLVMLECNDPQRAASEFSACMPAGDRLPQGAFACDPNVYAICETFESYNVGKLSIQSAEWTSPGCNFDGTEGDVCDVDVVSYWSGFTNYSGGRGMHIYDFNSFPEFNLGNQTGGTYELALKLYVPSGGSGGFFALTSDTWIVYPYFEQGNFYVNNVNNETEATATYSPDEWLDFVLIMDFNTQHRQLWLNGEQLLSVQDSNLNDLSKIAFYGNGDLGYFVDDITVRAIPSVADRPSPDRQAETALRIPTAQALTLFPNPASATVSVRYRLDRQTSGVLTLVNTLGQTIQVQPLTAVPQGLYTFDLSRLPAGLYSVRMVAGEEVLAKQFVKR